jgi:hypothetical protein
MAVCDKESERSRLRDDDDSECAPPVDGAFAADATHDLPAGSFFLLAAVGCGGSVGLSIVLGAVAVWGGSMAAEGAGKDAQKRRDRRRAAAGWSSATAREGCERLGGCVVGGCSCALRLVAHAHARVTG